MNKISSTISQAKNLISIQGMTCMPEKNDEDDISEEKDFFDQVPYGDFRGLPPKPRSVSWKSPKNFESKSVNADHGVYYNSDVKPFNTGRDSGFRSQ